MKLPRIKGIIRRRLLVNFRVDPAVMGGQLPQGMTPKLQNGHAIAGICLIRLEQLRLPALPSILGWSSENAAHRIAVIGPEGEEAVYIPRRDTSSLVNHLVGGRIFPGEHHLARFRVEDDGVEVRLKMVSQDSSVFVELHGKQARSLPSSSAFDSVEEASEFFETGSLGYSDSRNPERFDGIVLVTQDWNVTPLAISSVCSSYFEDPKLFPEGSVEFDHALIMRNIQHEWLSAPDYCVADAAI